MTLILTLNLPLNIFLSICDFIERKINLSEIDFMTFYSKNCSVIAQSLVEVLIYLSLRVESLFKEKLKQLFRKSSAFLEKVQKSWESFFYKNLSHKKSFGEILFQLTNSCNRFSVKLKFQYIIFIYTFPFFIIYVIFILCCVCVAIFIRKLSFLILYVTRLIFSLYKLLIYTFSLFIYFF